MCQTISYGNIFQSCQQPAAHGGSILDDYDVILHEVDQPNARVHRWKSAFDSHCDVRCVSLPGQG